MENTALNESKEKLEERARVVAKLFITGVIPLAAALPALISIQRKMEKKGME